MEVLQNMQQYFLKELFKAIHTDNIYTMYNITVLLTANGPSWKEKYNLVCQSLYLCIHIYEYELVTTSFLITKLKETN